MSGSVAVKYINRKTPQPHTNYAIQRFSFGQVILGYKNADFCINYWRGLLLCNMSIAISPSIQ